MKALPTVIILADPQMATQPHLMDAAMNHVSALDTTLRRVIASNLPRVLMAPPAAAQAASATLPGQDIITCLPPTAGQSPSDWLAACVATAVLHRPDASGWLLLPADMPMLNVNTLLAVAQGLPLAPIVFPCHRHMRGHPVGLSSELYVDLVRMQSDNDLRRLTARYPSVDVDVDDPGVLMTLDAHTGLNQLRACLTGPFRSSPFTGTA